jgi:cytochrome c5
VRRALAAALLLGAGLAACATAAPVPTPAQLARAQAHDPALTAERLEAGRARFVSRCSECHAAPEPSSRAPEAWPAEVARMGKRVHLPADQAQLITEYLQTVSQP